MSVLTERMSEGQLTRRSLVAGILVWFLHLNLTYGLPSVACKWGWFTSRVGPISTLQLLVTLITLLVLALMLLLIYLPLRTWLGYQPKQPPPPGNPKMLEETEEEHHPFLAFVTMLSNSLLALFVIAVFVPALAISPCGPL